MVSGTHGKQIFKRALKGRLPDTILERRKMGFGVPIVEWIRGEIKDYARELVLEGPASRLYFRQEFLEKMWNEHQRGIRNSATELWAIMMLNLWHQRFAG